VVGASKNYAPSISYWANGSVQQMNLGNTPQNALSSVIYPSGRTITHSFSGVDGTSARRSRNRIWRRRRCGVTFSPGRKN
jgi:hypothetical protein